MPLFRRFAAWSASIALIAAVAAPFAVSAQAPGGGFAGTLQSGLDAAAPAALKGSQTNPAAIVGNIVNALMGLLGVVLFGYLLYAGYLWMTAGGESKQVDSAKNMIKNAVIGLVIITLAYAISTFVVTKLGEATSSTPSVEKPPKPG